MVEALGLSITEVIFAVVNFLILVGVLAKFLYKPFLTMLENRQQSIKDAFDNAEAVNRRADEKMANYEKRIANAEKEAREIIKNAKIKADTQAQDIIENAKAEVAEMKLKADRDIEREKERAVADMKEQIAMLAMMAAEKILEKDIEIEGQEFIIDDIIEQAGASKWQN
ncbi:MAG: F0F1 ATP synthase subunit B [Clostridia bacterium]|nr:F0F1 ATP synthase subunit B [Clostridia bacterium]